MFISFMLSFLARRNAFSWSPALGLTDPVVYSTLLPGTQY